MKKPKAVYLYLDNFKHLKKMSAEDIGRLMIALMDYAEDGSLPDFSENMTLDVLFGMMSEQIDRDFEKYAQTCETRSKAAKTAAQARWHKNKDKCETHTNAGDGCVGYQKEEEKDYEEENENEYENDNKYEDEYDHDAHSAVKSRTFSSDHIISYIAPEPENVTDAEFSQLREVVDYYNQVSGKYYSAETFPGKKPIVDRLRDGYTVDEMRAVIDKKYHRLLSIGFSEHNLTFNLFGVCFKSYLDQAMRGA